MTIEQLKKSIIDKNVSDAFMIFLCSENSFLADQYAKSIADINQLTISNLQALADIKLVSNPLFGFKPTLNILKTETFSEYNADYTKLTNTIVICDKVDKSIMPLVQNYIVDMPKLKDWQVYDYILTLCPGLEIDEAKRLYEITYGNIYRIENEASKIALFPKFKQKEVFMQLYYQNGSDLFAIGDFDLLNAIISNNKVFVKELLLHRNSTTIDPLAITNQALTKFKKILFVNHSCGKSFEEVGISPSEASGIRKYCNNISLDRIQAAIRFLSGIDLKLKNGLLDMPKEQFVDYIICNLMR